MITVSDLSDLRQLSLAKARPCAFVPTMGALHQGHMELVRMAKTLVGEVGEVWVSIFVNPMQFDRPGDLANYPRTFESDLELCAEAGVDVVFAPEASVMYAPDRSITVTERSLSTTLCGATRPGHFDGVCTVVLKLFHLTGCDIAIFGEKDFQQLAVIRRMVRDLNVPVDIVECPTVREPDGLAISSRNVRLTPEQRADAPRIHRALKMAASGRTPDQVLDIARAEIEASKSAKIDYLELVDAETLRTSQSLDRASVLAAAVFYGEVRLIDHIGIPAKE